MNIEWTMATLVDIDANITLLKCYLLLTSVLVMKAVYKNFYYGEWQSIQLGDGGGYAGSPPVPPFNITVPVKT